MSTSCLLFKQNVLCHSDARYAVCPSVKTGQDKSPSLSKEGNAKSPGLPHQIKAQC